MWGPINVKKMKDRDTGETVKIEFSFFTSFFDDDGRVKRGKTI